MRIADAYFAGGFGQRIEKPRAGVAPEIADGQEIGQAGAKLGAALLGTATQAIDEQGAWDLIGAQEVRTEQTRQAHERETELKQQAKENDSELKRRVEAREKSRATTALVAHENTLTQIVGDLQRDTSLNVQEKRDQFKQMAEQTKANFMESVPEPYQYAFSPTFDEHRFAAANQLDVSLGHEVQQQAKASIFSTLEELERSSKPLESKLTVMRAIPDDVWRGAGIDAATQAKTIQTTADQMSRAELDRLLNNNDPRKILAQLRDRAVVNGVVDGDQGAFTNFRDLEPASREAYIHTTKARIEALDREAERRRHEAAQEQDRLARNAFEEYKDARSGLMQLSSKREAQLWQAMGGTDYVQRAKEIRKTTGSLSFVTKKLNEDPLTYGAAQKGLVIPPLDISTPQTWQAQLKARGVLAAAIKAENKLPYLPILTNNEAKNLGDYLKNQAPQGQVQTATGLFQAFGRESTERVAAQFATDNTSLGMVMALVANGKPGAAYHVANGVALGREKVQMKKPQIDELQTQVDGYLGDALTGQPMMRAAYGSAVKDAYLSMAATDGNLEGSIDKKIFQKAAGEVIGDVAKVNGKQVLLPTGVTENAFKDFMRGIGPDTVKRSGGVLGYSTDEEAANAIRGKGKLYEAGNGRYRFMIQGKPLVTRSGAPFELTLGYHDVKGTW